MASLEFDTLRFGTHAQREARVAKFKELTPEFDGLRKERDAKDEADQAGLRKMLGAH